MAIYLSENEVGTDAQVIGFPSLMGCMAIVLQTTECLIGWHAYGSDSLEGNDKYGFAGRIPAFAAYVQSVNDRGTPVHLYCVCNRGERFGKDKSKWKTETNLIAEALGYSALPITGYDLSSIGHEGSYAELVRDGDSRRCAIFYKRWSKTTTEMGAVDPNLQRMIRYNRGEDAYGIGNVATGRVITSVEVVETKSNKGQMHKASSGQLDTYMAP